MRRSLGPILALVTMAGPGASLASDDPRQIAETAAAQWNAAFAQGKVDDIVSLYADNAMLLQPNGAAIRSRGEIRAFWQTLIQTGAYAMDVVGARGEPDGSIVATVRLSEVKTLPYPQRMVMKYHYGGVLYSVLKRQPDGSWKAQVQRWTGGSRSL
jgi:ketosteroid isomerase-like protein